MTASLSLSISVLTYKAYGGDFLMEQPVDNLRGFFDAFFALDQDTWSGFLAGWPGLPGNVHHETWDRRLKFALNMFVKMKPAVRLAMVLYAIKYTFYFGPGTLLRSLTPDFLFGSGPEEYVWKKMPDLLGDDAAKVEAKTMMSSFIPSAGEHHKPEAKSEVKVEVEVGIDAETASAAVKKDLVGAGVGGGDVKSYPSPFNT